ncbi:MAG TPA: carboxymuconolactone decarboxylase family protein [Gemmatimonadaceae bacterium]|nr:carboxymuconolactone decarboxylase family protein [Gemmatimonadaceae bacterium]
MPSAAAGSSMISFLDRETCALVRLAAAIAGSDEATTRRVIDEIAGSVSPQAADEVILQSYLFAGFPRALNAARMWRGASGVRAPLADESASARHAEEWERNGEATCGIVYGASYELLRRNVRELHPALDAWMITDGYGKVLSRPALDLKRRELCVVAACAAAGQQRQLHSHLHGAINSGASPKEVSATLEALSDLVGPREIKQYQALLARVVASRSAQSSPDTG